MHHLGTKIAFADFTEQAQLLVLIRARSSCLT
jgi:hypothetical protein